MNLHSRFKGRAIEDIEDAIDVIVDLENDYEMDEAERIVRFFETEHGVILTRVEGGYEWHRKERN